jgi:hypothetical protein
LNVWAPEFAQMIAWRISMPTPAVTGNGGRRAGRTLKSVQSSWLYSITTQHFQRSWISRLKLVRTSANLCRHPPACLRAFAIEACYKLEEKKMHGMHRGSSGGIMVYGTLVISRHNFLITKFPNLLLRALC